MKSEKFSMEIAGKTLTAEFSNLTEQANGSVLLSYGETVVLATAVMAKSERAGLNFFPLSVDYEEKYYAAGQILGSRFVRRETRPSEDAILINRLIDRTIRPLFNKTLKNDVQVMVTTLSIDEDNDPDVLALVAASLALGNSNIPWDGPISACRVGYKDSAFIINPSYKEREDLEFEAVVSGKDNKINMIEVVANETPEETVLEAFQKAIQEIEKINKWQTEVIAKIGKEKIAIKIKELPTKFYSLFNDNIAKPLEDAIYLKDKQKRNDSLYETKKEWIELIKTEFNGDFLSEADDMYDKKIDEIVHYNILKNDKRPDLRKMDELRDIYAKTGVLSRTHGSAFFFRGETHTLSVVTLGAPGDELLIQGMETRTKKRFLHHYNFPPYSVGETGPMRGPGRREIGHGALAEKALKPIIPHKDDFPYIIRLVSETLSSNGSSSMAAACASCLALMDAGVPIKNKVAGIAMGLMMENEKNYKVLTDIQGPEDHHGDMDFKAAGTDKGLTAVQMDVKVDGVTIEILRDTLNQAKKARLEILAKMEEEISAPREHLSKYAPKIMSLQIPPERIGEVIGGGGKTINGIIDKTGAKINIEDDGTIYIAGETEESINEAANIIREIVREFKTGERATGKVVKIFEFGAMVAISAKIDGLIHISKLANYRVNSVKDIVNIGDTVEVEVIEIDDQKRVNLKLIKKI